VQLLAGDEPPFDGLVVGVGGRGGGGGGRGGEQQQLGRGRSPVSPPQKRRELPPVDPTGRYLPGSPKPPSPKLSPLRRSLPPVGSPPAVERSDDDVDFAGYDPEGRESTLEGKGAGSPRPTDKLPGSVGGGFDGGDSSPKSAPARHYPRGGRGAGDDDTGRGGTGRGEATKAHNSGRGGGGDKRAAAVRRRSDGKVVKPRATLSLHTAIGHWLSLLGDLHSNLVVTAVTFFDTFFEMTVSPPG
jgi:hypothetical protein